MRISIKLENLSNAQKSPAYSDLRVLRSEQRACFKLLICIEQIGENVILVQFHAILPNILSFLQSENI